MFLVSNLNQNLGIGGSNSLDHAQAFTTGGNPSGYKVTIVNIGISLSQGGSDLSPYTVELWSDSSDASGPGSHLYTLMNPATLGSGNQNFTAPGDGIDLEANTTYHVLLNNDLISGRRRISIRNTPSTDEDAGAAEGWSIADTSHFRNHDVTESEWTGWVLSRKIGIVGYAKSADATAPTLSSATAAGTTLTLTYDETLGTGSMPDATAFTVTVGSGTGTNPSSVMISGATVVLTLATAVTSAQTVTVSYTVPTANPIQDPSGNAAGSFSNQEVTVSDVVTPGIILSTMTLSVAEDGGAAAYTVRLSTAPSASVTIMPSSDDTGVATVSPSSLSFDATDWNMPKEVTVTGIDDDIDNATDRTATISNAVTASTDANYANLSADVVVTATDDDVKGVTVSSTAFAVGEGGGTGAYTVVLDSEPTGTVTVTVTSGTPGAATVSADSLTFTTTDWDTEQTVTVTGVEDAITNTPDRTTTIMHAVSGADYASGVTVSDVTVTVTDNDVAGFTFSTSILSVAEAGGTTTYTVRLNTQPTGAVTVTVESDPPGVATVSPSPLTFDATDWSTEQTVTVTGVNDDIDNVPDRTATITHSASGGGYGGISGSATVTATDDDTAGATVSPAMLTVGEGAAGASYTVVLDTEPTAAVTVTIASGDTGVATVDRTSLTFTMANWDTEQTVTVTAVDDNVASGARATTITHGASGGGYGSVAFAPVSVTVNDNDTTGVTITETALSVAEAGGSDTYAVRLNTQPTGTVTVTLAATPAGVVTLSPPTQLIFTTTDWNQEQTVTVTAVDDDTDNPTDRTATIMHTPSGGGYDGVAAGSVVVTLEDDDDPGVTLSRATLSVAESDSASYTVVLDTQPSADVTVTPSSGAPGIATVSGALTFTMSNWNRPQEVTVTVVDDAIDHVPDRTATISHALASADAGYASVSVNDVAVTATDDESVGLTVSPEEPSLDEETRSGTYTVVLNSQPTANVTVTIMSGDTGVAVDPASLTFTAANWSMTQTVTVTATEAAQGSVTLTHTAADAVAGSASGYAGAEARVTVEVGTQARERIAQATKMTQPEFLRMAMNFAVEAITARLAPGGREPGGSALGLAGRLLDASGVASAGRMPQLGLSAQPGGGPGQAAIPSVSNLPAVGAAPGHAASEGALSRALGESGASIWASGGYRKQNGRDGDHLSWSGDAYHLHVGVDKPFGDDLIGGLSVGYFSSDFDYTDRSGSAAAGGSIDTKISSIQPYLGWRASERLNLWGMAGYGDGDIEVRDGEMETQISDADQRMVALGGSYRLRGEPSTLQLDLKAEVSAGRLKIDGNGEDIEASSVSATRWRLAVEGTREVAMDESCRLLPSFGLGARVDRGDGVTGTGVEVNAGLDYHDTLRGLLMQTDVRWLPGYGSTGRVREWAASGTLRLLPRAGGRGLSFELSQSWGDVASGVERLWHDGATQSWGDAAASGPRLETRLGYGINGMDGLLTPYFGATHEGERASLLLGADWQRGRTSFSLRGERRGGAEQEPDYSLRLELSSSW